ncbi:Similar to TSPAN9: Tetraspanin-9 (Sus scrofa) [Cotesia congregata]|uniref:Tetraspanin n=1 Tax=Cotesia congregata TaxID=51543 RepID=A0A8J2MB89_COTCN|nr:Similar to TSPAN9: Tetraspanin-9 (Sus scrofa) [Cotesia congregata]
MSRTGYTCIRHVFCSLNVLVWLSACGILGAVLWLRLATSGLANLVPQYNFASADTVFLIIGGVTFVVAFFGCCGAWFQSRFMLITLHCCGVRDYTDWFQIDAWPTEDRVPDSCCIKRERYCGRLDPEGRNKESWYKEGCAAAIQTWVVQRLHVLGSVGLIVGFLQLFGLVTSMILFCTVKHKRASHSYKSYDTSAS